MRILAINTFNDRSEVALWRGLVKAGASVDMICDSAAPERDTLEKSGIPTTSIEIRHRLDFQAAAQIREKLRSGKYDILHVTRNRELSVSLIASRGMNIKRVAYRGTIGHISWFDPASWLTYLNPRVDRIICVSEAVRKYLLSLHLPARKLVTIHKGFDIRWYSPVKRACLAEFGIPDESFVVGFAGDMRPVKGVRYLVESARYLPADMPAHYLLVGRVRDENVRTAASNNDAGRRMHFTGFRQDAPGLMGACDVVVLSSIEREGIGKSAVEAMAQGVPAIVTNVGGLPEVVVDNECGLIVPPGDPEAIAKAILFFAEDSARRALFGRRARERIAAEFNIEKMIEKTSRMYEESLMQD